MSHSYSRAHLNELRISKESDHPSDSIGCIVWDIFKNEPAFLSGCWDGFIHYYEVRGQTSQELVKAWSFFCDSPVTSVDIAPHHVAVVGLASGDVVCVSMQNNQAVILGRHPSIICGVFFIKELNLVASLGFDKIINFWTFDKNQNGEHLCMKVDLPVKTYTVAVDYPIMLIGSAESSVCFIDLRRLNNLVVPPYVRIKIDNGSHFICSRVIFSVKAAALGTVDGRCGTFTFADTNEGFRLVQLSLNTYSCQRVDISSSKRGAGQVNSIELGPHNFNTFLVAAGSSQIAMFNNKSKLKLPSIKLSNASGYTAVRLSPNLKYMAYASGSDWLKGLTDLDNLKNPKINCIRIQNSDLSHWTSNM